jgi:hypothetical protein
VKFLYYRFESEHSSFSGFAEVLSLQKMCVHKLHIATKILSPQIRKFSTFAEGPLCVCVWGGGGWDEETI